MPMAGMFQGLNFRDLGGIKVRGGALRRGLIYRSEGPVNFSDEQHAVLAALGFRLVCDLRSPVEQRVTAGNWVKGARVIRCDIAADFRAMAGSDWRSLGDVTAEKARAKILANYAAMPAALKPHLAGLIEAMLAGETPLLIHCTAGKDRTGVLVALFLKLLGASDNDILRDYLLSACFGESPENRTRIGKHLERALGCMPGEGVVDAVIGVDPAYPEAAFAAVKSRWGSVENYFADAGVDHEVRQRLVARLVEPEAQME